MNKKEYDVKRVSKWECPSETGIPLITMPNVPRPLHGLPPRKIMGNATWNHVRKRCYFDAGYNNLNKAKTTAGFAVNRSPTAGISIFV